MGLNIFGAKNDFIDAAFYNIRPKHKKLQRINSGAFYYGAEGQTQQIWCNLAGALKERGIKISLDTIFNLL